MADSVTIKRRVKIIDLADALGLTKGTVSRALNGYSDISETTRIRVRKQAEKMGYRPLAQAQAIRTGRARSIGLVLHVGGHDSHRPFLADFLAGLSQTATALNWSLTVANAESEAEMLATMGRLVDDRKADGFVLPRTQVNDPRVALLRAAEVPFVMYGRTGDDTGCAWFDIAGEDAMASAVARLVGQGHGRIGFVNGGQAFNYSVLREAGFCAGMAAYGLDVDPDLMARDVLTRDAGATVVREMLVRPEPPTAIVFAVDMAALGAYDAAAQLGLTIGRDLSVISYDGVPEGAFMTPPLTTFAVDTRQAGARLAALLMERVRGTAPEVLRETAPATLMVRGSDGPPRQTSAELAQMMQEAALSPHPNTREES